MNIHSFEALVFQVNLVDNYSFLDNRGKVFSKILTEKDKLIQNGDTLKTADDKAEYSLDTTAFVMKLNKTKIQEFIENDKLIPQINALNGTFIKRTNAICDLLDVKKISRFACRFIVKYSGATNKDLEKVFDVPNDLLKKDLKNLRKELSISGLNFKSYYNDSLLALDVDTYINTEKFNINEIESKYKLILENFRKNISDPQKIMLNINKHTLIL